MSVKSEAKARNNKDSKSQTSRAIRKGKRSLRLAAGLTQPINPVLGDKAEPTITEEGEPVEVKALVPVTFRKVLNRELREEKQRLFLELRSNGEPTGSAAQLIETPIATVYHWRDDYPEFKAAWDAVEQKANTALIDRLEQAAWKRALEGFDDPVYYRGELVATNKRYSDTLLIFMLKGAHPQKYKERTEVSGDQTQPIKIKLTWGDSEGGIETE